MDNDLKQRCTEILDWQKTGLLHSGEGGKLRELANKLGSERGIPERYRLTVAEKITQDEALKYVVDGPANVDDEGEAVVVQYQLAAAVTALREIAAFDHNCRSTDIAREVLAIVGSGDMAGRTMDLTRPMGQSIDQPINGEVHRPESPTPD